jgi:hypothetical protein
MDCSLDFDGVQDMLGEPLTSAASSMQFTTLAPEPGPIVNPMSEYPHTADGQLTDWEEGAEEYEYFDVQAARGMYSHFYADFDGERLWILNDWYYNGDDIDPDCYNLFGVWTAGGNDRWEIRAYGDQHVEVRLNGLLLEKGDDRVTGGYSRTATPNDAKEHTVYEIAVQTQPGSWGVQLHDPGPSFGCERLETDPTNYAATTDGDGTTIDPTLAPTVPTKPVARQQSGTGTLGTLTPSLAWTSEDAPGNGTTYVLELFVGQGTEQLIYRRVVYGNDLTLPAGLVKNGQTYSWRVVARNDAGVTEGDLVTFTVQAGEVATATLTSMSPSEVPFGSATTVLINGSGFVSGAVVLFNGSALETTVASSTQLSALLTNEFTQVAGVYAVTVRNGDSNTVLSGGFEFTVLAPIDASGTAVLSSLSIYEVTVGTTTTVEVYGSNFASNAYVFFDNVNLPTTWVSSTQINGVIDDSLSAEPGTHSIGVRNNPQDNTTWSGTATFTIVAEAQECVHSECLPGARLASGCSQCATDICTQNSTCCEQNWGSACVALAANTGSCTALCTPPSVLNLDPISILPNTSSGVTVTVNMANAPSTEIYHMRLTPTQGANIDVTCTTTGTNILACAGDQLPAGVYDVNILVGDYFGDGILYTTNGLTDALTVAAAPQGTDTCAGQATVQFQATGSGTCASPFVIDTSDALGDTWYHTVSAAFLNNESDETLGNAVCTEGTQRDIIFRVDYNPSATTATFAASGPGANVIVARTLDNVCNSGFGACSNQGGSGSCDTVTNSSPGTSVYYVVSEATQSGVAITVSGNSSNAQ